MRLRTTTVLSFNSLAVLALTGCSTDGADSIDPTSSATVSVRSDGESAPASAPLSSAALAKRLLDESDLGEGYTRTPQRPVQQFTAPAGPPQNGCPALETLGGEAAAGGGLDFPRRAKVSFTYASGTGSEMSEGLYSGTVAELSGGVGRIFEAMTSCSSYQLVVGSTAISVTTQKVPATRLGEECWSLLLTFTDGGRGSVMKQTAVRTGTVVVVISGSPSLVDAQLRKAVAKAAAGRSTG
ncbi:hypothetical protein [Streptomyces sp. NEAU-YJ-81]|uniref:hypothetical protein n=1 Tax=Streptomyces sp. NEAU-YJ-81 TaxID=2820288 RepID=UPI001ABCA8DC|nr:hypothetical protein [Streptomyces sp. NEAU-YJ-81]MBO3674003.1 hypothetical protein [Streptomyces sp. NEAU-YJ-81]